MDLPHGERQDTAAVREPPDDTTGQSTSLARRIAQGDAAAEAELAERFHGRVRALALARLHNADAALDLAQDPMATVLQALRAGHLREADKLPAFVLGTARNLISNYRRKRDRGAVPMDDASIRDPPADGDPAQAALAGEERELIRAALGRLGVTDRRILLLTLVEDLHPREIASIVGLSAQAVRTHKSRAIKAIADEIDRLTRIAGPEHIPTRGRD